MRRALIAIVVGLGTAIAPACGGAADETAPTIARETTATTGSATTVAPTSLATTTTLTSRPGTEADAGSGQTLGATLLTSMPEGEITSGRFEMIFSLTPAPGGELEGPIEIRMAGATAANGDSEFLMDFGAFFLAAGDSEDVPEEFLDVFAQPMEMKTIGDLSYARGGFFAMLLGSDKWIEGDADDATTESAGLSVGALSDDPTQMLGALEDANANVEVIGTEEINGVITTHYRATLDIASLAEELSETERVELEASLGDISIPSLPIDLWIGEDDGFVYRYVMELGAEALGDDAEEFSAVRMEFNLWDYGGEIIIDPPAPEDIATEDELSFGFGDG